MYAGLSHVLGRIDYYMTLASLLTPGSWRDDAKFRSQQDTTHGQISRQYRKILEFEMNCVCAAASAWNPAAKNVVDWNGLAGMIKTIQEADEELVECIRANATAVTRHRLLKSYQDLEPLATAEDSMNHHHMAAIATAVVAWISMQLSVEKHFDMGDIVEFGTKKLLHVKSLKWEALLF
jgi:hypothetical protein